jgi:phosphomannomutase
VADERMDKTGMASKRDTIPAKFSGCLCLFDVDGTLTKPRQIITPEIDQFLEQLKTRVQVGLVGGSDLVKISEQLGAKSDDPQEAIAELVQKFDCVFGENGLVAYRNGQVLDQTNIGDFMGEEKLQRFINFCLRYMSDLKLPSKRGNFVEYRTGLINVCPVGRSCNQRERDEFSAFDKEHGVRAKFIEALRSEFPPEFGLNFSIGGQISIDAFPIGWDKTYALKYLQDFEKIYFFGDRTDVGGNDYEIYDSPRTIGYTVTSPEHTKEIVSQLFL